MPQRNSRLAMVVDTDPATDSNLTYYALVFTLQFVSKFDLSRILMLIRATVELKMPSRRSRSRANKNLAEAQRDVARQLEKLDEKVFLQRRIPSGYVSDGEGQRLSEEFHASILPSTLLKPTYAKIVSGEPKESAAPTTRSSMIGKKKLWGDESDDESEEISHVREEVAEVRAEVREEIADVREEIAEVRDVVEDIGEILENVAHVSIGHSEDVEDEADEPLLSEFDNVSKLLTNLSFHNPVEHLQVGSVVHGTPFRTPGGGSSLFHAAALALYYERKGFDPAGIDALQTEYEQFDPIIRENVAWGLRSETIICCRALVVSAQDIIPLFCDQDGLNRFCAIRDSLLGISDNHFWAPDKEIPWELVIGLCYSIQSIITVVGPELDGGYEVTTNFTPRLVSPNHIVLRWDGANYSPLLNWHSV